MLYARAAISIEASVQDAWQLLTDFPRYSEWNPFIVKVDGLTGPLGVGSEFTLRVKWPSARGGASSRERLSVLQPPTARPDGTLEACLAYVYIDVLGRLRLLQATRVHVLTQAPGGPTRYETQEDFSGVLSGFLPLRQVQAGFDAQTCAMKATLEARVH